MTGTRIEFTVQSSLIGVMIGKKGVRVQEVIKETGVRDISVDGNSGNLFSIQAYYHFSLYFIFPPVFSIVFRQSCHRG